MIKRRVNEAGMEERIDRNKRNGGEDRQTRMGRVDRPKWG